MFLCLLMVCRLVLQIDWLFWNLVCLFFAFLHRWFISCLSLAWRSVFLRVQWLIRAALSYVVYRIEKNQVTCVSISWLLKLISWHCLFGFVHGIEKNQLTGMSISWLLKLINSVCLVCSFAVLLLLSVSSLFFLLFFTLLFLLLHRYSLIFKSRLRTIVSQHSRYHRHQHR